MELRICDEAQAENELYKTLTGSNSISAMYWFLRAMRREGFIRAKTRVVLWDAPNPCHATLRTDPLHD